MTKAVFLIDKITPAKINFIIKNHFDTVFIDAKNLTTAKLKALKKHHLRVFVEIGIFVGQDLWQKYPDSRPIDKHDHPAPLEDWYAPICPTHPQIRRQKFNQIKKILQMGVNGLALDFIRYPCHWETKRNQKITEYCFCPRCLQKYHSEVIPAHRSPKRWSQWKSAQVTDFVFAVKNLITLNSPQTQLTLFAVPWTQTQFNGAINKIICQDFSANSQYVDFFIPMLYHRFVGRPVSWIGDTVKYFSQLTPKPVLPIIQTENRAGLISPIEFRQSLAQASKPPSLGYIIFFLEDLLQDPEKIKIFN